MENNTQQPVAPPVAPVAAPATPPVAPIVAPPVAAPVVPVAAPVAAPVVPVAAPPVATPVAPPVAPIAAPVAAPPGYAPNAAPPPPPGPAPIVSDPSLDGDTLAQAPVMSDEQIKQEYESTQQNAKGPEYAKMVLSQGDNYLRLIGLHRNIKIHWIPGDDGNTRPYRCTDDCPICHVISPFLSFTLVEAAPGANKKMRRKYAFEDISMSLSKKVTGDSSIGQQGWAGKKRTLFNCISKMDNWCAENNHTKVLAYSEKAIGIGGGCADDIWQLAKEYGEVGRYDIKIGRAGLQRNTKYTVMLRAQGMFALTELEQNYKIYNLDKIIEAYPHPANVLTDAPNAIKEIIGFLTLQGVTQQSPALLKIAEQLGINASIAQAVQVPGQAPALPAPPVAAPVAPVTAPVAAPVEPAPVPPTAVTPVAQAPTTLAPEVPSAAPPVAPVAPVAGESGGPPPTTPPTTPAGETKACVRCGDQNNAIDAQQCSFCGALFQA